MLLRLTVTSASFPCGELEARSWTLIVGQGIFWHIDQVQYSGIVVVRTELVRIWRVNSFSAYPPALN